MFGHRGIYRKGWTAVTLYKTPWIMIGEKAFQGTAPASRLRVIGS
jgi:hypothetical protein